MLRAPTQQLVVSSVMVWMAGGTGRESEFSNWAVRVGASVSQHRQRSGSQSLSSRPLPCSYLRSSQQLFLLSTSYWRLLRTSAIVLMLLESSPVRYIRSSAPVLQFQCDIYGWRTLTGVNLILDLHMLSHLMEGEDFLGHKPSN